MSVSEFDTKISGVSVEFRHQKNMNVGFGFCHPKFPMSVSNSDTKNTWVSVSDFLTPKIPVSVSVSAVRDTRQTGLGVSVGCPRPAMSVSVGVGFSDTQNPGVGVGVSRS